jgi:hypothetical protein
MLTVDQVTTHKTVLPKRMVSICAFGGGVPCVDGREACNPRGGGGFTMSVCRDALKHNAAQTHGRQLQGLCCKAAVDLLGVGWTCLCPTT